MIIGKKTQILFLFLILISNHVCAQKWTQANGLLGEDIKCISIKDTTIIVGTNSRIITSLNNGTNWSSANNGLSVGSVNAIAFIDNKIIAGTDKGLFKSVDNGLNWDSVYTGIINDTIRAIGVHNSDIYIGTSQGMFLSSDNGLQWNPVNNGLSTLAIQTIAVKDTLIITGTKGGGIFISADNGNSWSASNTGLTDLNINVLILKDTNIIAGTDTQIFYSSDNGISWTESDYGSGHINALAVGSDYIIAGTVNHLIRSFDNGVSWEPVYSINNINALAVSDTNVYAGCVNGLFVTPYTTDQNWWFRAANRYCLTDKSISSLIINGNRIMAGTTNDFYNQIAVYASDNEGVTWDASATGINSDQTCAGGYTMNSFAKNSSKIFVSNCGKVFFSGNNGDNWSPINNGLTGTAITTLYASDLILFAGTPGGAFVSNNNGYNWDLINDGIENCPDIRAITENSSGIYGGNMDCGVYRFDFPQHKWIPTSNTGLTNPWVYSLATNGTYLYAGTWGSGLFRSSDNGESWQHVNNGMGNKAVTSILAFGTNIFAGTAGHGVYLSKDAGGTWTPINEGLGDVRITTMAADEKNIYAGMFSGGGVMKRQLAEFNIIYEENPPIHNFIIFPNPATDKITIDIDSYVSGSTLLIYDVKGQKIYQKELTEKITPIDISRLSAGIYFLKYISEKAVGVVKFVKR